MKNANRSNPDKKPTAPPPLTHACECGAKFPSRFALKKHERACNLEI